MVVGNHQCNAANLNQSKPQFHLELSFAQFSPSLFSIFLIFPDFHLISLRALPLLTRMEKFKVLPSSCLLHYFPCQPSQHKSLQKFRQNFIKISFFPFSRLVCKVITIHRGGFKVRMVTRSGNMRHRDQGDQSYQLLACSIAAQSNKFFQNYSKRYTSKYENMMGRGDFVASNFGSGSQ